MDALVNIINDRSGQPELFRYFALHQKEDVSKEARSLVGRVKAIDIVRPEIRIARKLKADHPEMIPAEVAKAVMTTEEHKTIIRKMIVDLELYVKCFDEYFDSKLKRAILVHLVIRVITYVNLSAAKKVNYLQQYHREKSLNPWMLGGTLYVDTWAVPFFNTATQNKKEALEGVEKTLAVFKTVDLTNDVSMYQFVNLVALYARPEFDDVRRYKLQLFPSDNDKSKYGKERSDGQVISNRYPDETFLITTNELSLDELSFTFGRKIHYMGLIPHSDTIRADGRLFVGTSDFFEHDHAHGYFSIQLPVPGTPEQWIQIHEDYRLIQRLLKFTRRARDYYE